MAVGTVGRALTPIMRVCKRFEVSEGPRPKRARASTDSDSEGLSSKPKPSGKPSGKQTKIEQYFEPSRG